MPRRMRLAIIAALAAACAAPLPTLDDEIHAAHVEALDAWQAATGVRVALPVRIVGGRHPDANTPATAALGAWCDGVAPHSDAFACAEIVYVRHRVAGHAERGMLGALARHEIGHAYGVPHLAQIGAVMSDDLGRGCITAADASAAAAVLGVAVRAEC